MKPHITVFRIGKARLWACGLLGSYAFGFTPKEAYRAYRAEYGSVFDTFVGLWRRLRRRVA